MRHPDGRAVLCQFIRDVIWPKGTLRNVLAIIGMGVEELQKLL